MMTSFSPIICSKQFGFAVNLFLYSLKDKQHILEERQTIPDSGAGSSSGAIPIPGLENNDLMPSSLSQVDASVLQQLPEELRADIFESLPAHRRQEISVLGPNKDNYHPSGIMPTDNQPGSTDTGVKNNLWIGNPPLWVDKFKVSNLLILKYFADMYYKANSAESLSSILQRTVAESLHPLDARCDAWNEAVQSFSELLMEYIKLKIVLDIEEIYVCFRLLRRYVILYFVEVSHCGRRISSCITLVFVSSCMYNSIVFVVNFFSLCPRH